MTSAGRRRRRRCAGTTPPAPGSRRSPALRRIDRSTAGRRAARWPTSSFDVRARSRRSPSSSSPTSACPAWRWRSSRTARVLSRRAATASPTTRAPMPVEHHTVFRLASLSKAFAGTLSRPAGRRRRAALGQPSVTQYCRDFQLRDPQAAQQLTVRRRAQPPRRPAPTTPTTATSKPTSITTRWRRSSPTRRWRARPAHCYAYQNIAFSLIGDLVFAATGDFYRPGR